MGRVGESVGFLGVKLGGFLNMKFVGFVHSCFRFCEIWIHYNWKLELYWIWFIVCVFFFNVVRAIEVF